MLDAARRNFASTITGLGGKKLKIQTKLLINGNWVDSVSGKTFATCDPSTGKQICKVAEAQKEDVDLAVQAAKDAFYQGPWSNMSAHHRQELMTEFANQLLIHKEELIAIECTDNGK
jgi:aldehyde dehydrogenase (NAD+)